MGSVSETEKKENGKRERNRKKENGKRGKPNKKKMGGGTWEENPC